MRKCLLAVLGGLTKEREVSEEGVEGRQYYLSVLDVNTDKHVAGFR